MSRVQKIEAELQGLSREEALQVRDFLENLLEDQLQFTQEFEDKILKSEREMVAGKYSRIRDSGTQR